MQKKSPTLAALGFALLVPTGNAVSQCPVTTPQKFEPPPAGMYPTKFLPGFAREFSIYGAPGARRLMMRQNFGYSIFGLASPQSPSLLASHDIEETLPVLGDGTETVSALGASADGSRAIVSYRQTPHGNLLMGATGSIFGFAGEFRPSRAFGGVVIQQIGARYIGYALTNAGLTVADVTGLLKPPDVLVPGSIASEQVEGAPGGTQLQVVGNTLVYQTASGFVIVDASLVGPAVPFLSSQIRVYVHAPQAFGLPAGTASSITAGIHPVTQTLYVLAETRTDGTNGFGLAKSTDGGATLTKVGGIFLPPPPFSGPGSASPGVSTLVPTANGLMALFFSGVAGGSNKLSSMLVDTWGTDQTPAAVFNPASFSGSDFVSPLYLRGFDEGGSIHAYVGTGQAAFALKLTCAPLSSVAIALSGSSSVCVTGTSGTATVTDTGGAGSTHRWGYRTAAGGPITFLPGRTGTTYTLTGADFPGTGSYRLVCESTPALGSVLVSNEIPVSVTPKPVAVATNGGPYCGGQTVQLIAQTVAGATYSWTGPNGFTSSAQNPIVGSAIVTRAGTYTLTVTAGGCSSDPATTDVSVFDALAVSVPSVVCPSTAGYTANVVAPAGGTTYVWAITNGTLTSGQGTNTVTFTPGASGNVSISCLVTASCGSQNIAGVSTIDPACKGPLRFYTLEPCRVLDTRDADGPYGGPALGAGEERLWKVGGRCGVPLTAKSVSANVTVLQPSSTGSLRLYPATSAPPNASAISFFPGVTRASSSMVPLSGAGEVKVYADLPSGATHMILDVSGYFE